MTFDEWYSANVAPTLPNDIPQPLRDAARASMASCWNAAIDAIWSTKGAPDPNALADRRYFSDSEFAEMRAK